MASQVRSEETELFDIRLLCNQNDQKEFGCGRCKNLAKMPYTLSCDEKHHEVPLTFYCQECVDSIQEDNKCPINQHSNPILLFDKRAKIKIERSIQFICPYSTEFKQKGDGQVIDTMGEEGKAGGANAGCTWKGTYIALQQHVKVCPYKPKENKMIKDMKADIQSLNDIIEIQTKQIKKMNNRLDNQSQKLQQSQNNANSQSKTIQTIQKELVNIKQDMNTLKNECKDDINNITQKIDTMDIDGLKKNVNELNNKSPASSVSSVDSGKYGLYLSIICCVMVAMMGYFIYKHENSIMTMRRTDNNIVNEDSMDISGLMQSIQAMEVKVSGLEMSMEESRQTGIKADSDSISVDKMKSMAVEIRELQKSIQELKQNDDKADDDANSTWMRWIFNILYPIPKLFGQFVGCTALSIQWHIPRNDTWIVLAGFVGSHLITHILYFGITKVIILMIYVVVFGCAAFGMNENEEPMAHGYILGSILMAQLNVLYWCLWMEKNILFVMMAIGVSGWMSYDLYLDNSLNEFVRGSTREKDQKFSVFVLCIGIDVCLLLYSIFF